MLLTMYGIYCIKKGCLTPSTLILCVCVCLINIRGLDNVGDCLPIMRKHYRYVYIDDTDGYPDGSPRMSKRDFSEYDNQNAHFVLRMDCPYRDSDLKFYEMQHFDKYNICHELNYFNVKTVGLLKCGKPLPFSDIVPYLCSILGEKFNGTRFLYDLYRDLWTLGAVYLRHIFSSAANDAFFLFYLRKQLNLYFNLPTDLEESSNLILFRVLDQFECEGHIHDTVHND